MSGWLLLVWKGKLVVGGVVGGSGFLEPWDGGRCGCEGREGAISLGVVC